MSFLDAILLDAPGIPAEPPKSMYVPSTGAREVTGYRYWYDSIIDAMLAHPEWSLVKVARALNRGPKWIYLIVKSDSFREHYDFRRREHNDRLTGGVLSKAAQVGNKALDILLKQLEDNPESFRPQDVLEISSTMMTKMGMGVAHPQQSSVLVQPTVVVASASPSELTRAREIIKAAEAARLSSPQIIEHEPRPKVADRSEG